jgi:hypothetical protein
MQIIENEVVSDKTITIDEKHFVNCKYKNCVVIYSGGDYAWTDTAESGRISGRVGIRPSIRMGDPLVTAAATRLSCPANHI